MDVSFGSVGNVLNFLTMRIAHLKVVALLWLKRMVLAVKIKLYSFFYNRIKNNMKAMEWKEICKK